MGMCQMDCPTSGGSHKIHGRAQCACLPNKYTCHVDMATAMKKKFVLKVQLNFRHSNRDEQVQIAFRPSI